jgi:hypothetical protein
LSLLTVNTYNQRSIVSALLPTSKQYSMTASRDHMMSAWCLALLNTSYCKLRYWFWGVAPPPIAECMHEMEICIPYQARCGPEGSRRFRFPDFMAFGTWMWWGCQLHIPAAFTPRKCSWYWFSVVDPRATVRSEGNVTEKSQGRPTSSAVP